MAGNSFGAAGRLDVGDATYRVHRLAALGDVSRLPYSLKVLLENLLRHEDGASVRPEDIEALARWDGTPPPGLDLAFRPARVLMQDLTGVPAVVDLAAMRDAVVALGGDGRRVNPLVPVELVIDHSVIAEVARRRDAFAINARLERERNRERYALLRWAQGAFDRFVVVPPDVGICHQVNLEYLSRVVFRSDDGEAYPDTLVGTDSHTPMVNGLGVLGWGVGGIEAEAAMLGQPLSMAVPPVVGVRLTGELAEGTTATDLVLAIAELLRHHGVVGKLVECFGPGAGAVPLENRATIGNMSPEYGATATMFAVDEETLRYLRVTGRPPEQVALVEAYAKEQGLWADEATVPAYTELVELDLGSVEPSIAGPARPQDRVPLAGAPAAFRRGAGDEPASGEGELPEGAVVIAAITSCTNTSNPQVMVAAGLLARRAVELGLETKPWVKTSLAPGSQVVTGYLEAAGLLEPLARLGFDLVGYGCTTCIGNSGPLLEGVSEELAARGLAASAVLSGNRNFEGRIHPDVRMNWLASPPLVVAYALAGSMTVDLQSEPLGHTPTGEPVYLRDLWPTPAQVAEVIRESMSEDLFRRTYADVFTSDTWGELDVPDGDAYTWDSSSTYVRRPPFFDGLEPTPAPVRDVRGAAVLALLGDSVTTDHISPAGSIPVTTPAGEWLLAHGVAREDFNSYGTRRGNHEVMVRGTFANIRLRNQLVPGSEGGVSAHLPDGTVATIYETSARYREEGRPLVVVAGKEYGSGSSRDWAAKGPLLLGVVAVLAETFERIHRSNLVGMGILPLELPAGETAASLGLTGREPIDIEGIEALNSGVVPERVTVRAGGRSFEARVRLDTPQDAEYFRHGGILPYVARQLAGR
jgi:aconitate hydratase